MFLYNCSTEIYLCIFHCLVMLTYVKPTVNPISLRVATGMRKKSLVVSVIVREAVVLECAVTLEGQMSEGNCPGWTFVKKSKSVYYFENLEPRIDSS